MLMLAVCGQDLHRFELALFDTHGCRAMSLTEDPPERYLARLDAFLSEYGVSCADLSHLLVVTGPGSFTASRISVTCVNTIAFTQHIPIIPLQNPGRLPLKDLLEKTDPFSLPSTHYATPHYDRPPFITVKKQAVDESLGTNP